MRYTEGDVEWRGREEDERGEKRAKEKKSDMLLLLTWRKEQVEEEVKVYEYGRSDGGIGVYGHVMGNGLFY